MTLNIMRRGVDSIGKIFTAVPRYPGVVPRYDPGLCTAEMYHTYGLISIAGPYWTLGASSVWTIFT